MKRRLLGLCAALVLALGLCVPALGTETAAGTTTYTYDNVSASFPSELTVFTRDFDEQDPRIAASWVSAAELADYMDDYANCMLAYPETLEYFICINHYQGDETDSGKDSEAYRQHLVEYFADYPDIVLTLKPDYVQEQMRFVRYELHYLPAGDWTIGFYNEYFDGSSVDGQAVDIDLIVNLEETPVSAAQEQVLCNVVDSIRIGAESAPGAEPQLVQPVDAGRFCRRCGARLQPDAAFCTACGTPAAQPEEAQP